MPRLIFHVDVNSAFLSWEAAKRVREGQPDLRLIPSAIGGDVEKRTGIILAKSIPAKKFGIKTGEPVLMALRKCPELVLAKPDFIAYRLSDYKKLSFRINRLLGAGTFAWDAPISTEHLGKAKKYFDAFICDISDTCLPELVSSKVEAE